MDPEIQDKIEILLFSGPDSGYTTFDDVVAGADLVSCERAKGAFIKMNLYLLMRFAQA